MLDENDDIHPLFAGAPDTTAFRKLRKRIVRHTREAIEQYGMIERGGKWLVCLSGGKDSYTLLAVLHELQWRGLLPVELLAEQAIKVLDDASNTSKDQPEDIRRFEANLAIR